MFVLWDLLKTIKKHHLHTINLELPIPSTILSGPMEKLTLIVVDSRDNRHRL